MAIRAIIPEKQTINVVDIVGELVDSIRETGIVSSFTEANGVYSIVSENSLSANEYIVIDEVVYLVADVTSSSFQITGVVGIDFLNKAWKSERPYYEHGHIAEIAGTLVSKSGGPEKMRKYPMVCLIEDFESNVGPGVFIQSTLNMLIITETNKDYKAAKRYSKSFNPVLTPIYQNLIKAFVSSNAILTQFGTISHDPVYRVYLGKKGPYGVTSHIFNDPVDAIEIKDIDAKFYKKNC